MKKIKRFEDFIKESVNEFLIKKTSKVDFESMLDNYSDEVLVNKEVLMSKAQEDEFKGDLKEVKSRKSGRKVLIYRPSINISSTLESHEENGDLFIFIEEGHFDEYGDPEDGIEIGYSVLTVYKSDSKVDEDDIDTIDEMSNDKDVYEEVGSVKVKFWEGEDREEIIEVVKGDIDISKVKILFPSL